MTMSVSIRAKPMLLTMGAGLCGVSEGAPQLSSLFHLPSCLIHKSCPTWSILQLIAIYHPTPSPTQAGFAALCLELRVSSRAGSLVACRGGRGPSVSSSHQPCLLSQRGCPGDGVHRILNRTLFPVVQFQKGSPGKSIHMGKTQASPQLTHVLGGLMRQLRDKQEARLALTEVMSGGPDLDLEEQNSSPRLKCCISLFKQLCSRFKSVSLM